PLSWQTLRPVAICPVKSTCMDLPALPPGPVELDLHVLPSDSGITECLDRSGCNCCTGSESKFRRTVSCNPRRHGLRFGALSLRRGFTWPYWERWPAVAGFPAAA